ncbi:hypothetical protein ACFYP4_15335 [Streptomyces sp. NPDC005551]|uniref:hypothetical protein n=1 Tax=unclassified Streptomyces TaxID=2593676 RepID=UPI0033C8AA64
MGSLRNPVGPLPSSIYWRRRAVLLSVVGLLALLVLWVIASGGGGGNNNGDGSNGKNPAPSITPGPSSSGPAISQHPGGRDESSGSGDGGDGGGGSGAGGGAGAGTGGGAGSTGSAGGSGSGFKDGGSGEQLPAGSGLANCTGGSVKLTLRSVHNTYAPGRKPTIELTVKNSASGACKVDLGPKNTVLTITQAGGDDAFWSSKDCPKGSGSLLLRVPADGQVTRTLEWDRKASAPECATPPAGSASAGTYLVEAKAPGLAKAQTSFVLEKD